MEELKCVEVVVGLVDGGIGINWGFLQISKGRFPDFLNTLLMEMGFSNPKLVHITRNAIGNRVDWGRVRIANDECQLQGISPWEAVQRARVWLSSEKTYQYGVKFMISYNSVTSR